MLSQVGSVTTNGVQQQTLFANTANLLAFGAPTPTWPGVLPVQAVAPGQFPLFSGVRVFHRDYKNPRIYAYNVAYEQQLMADWAVYGDFTWTEGRNLTRFLNYNRTARHVLQRRARHRQHVLVPGRRPVEPLPRRSDGRQQLRRVDVPRPDTRHPQALLRGLSARGQLRARQGRRQRLERARSVHRPQLQLLRSGAGLGPVGPRHPAQGEPVRLLHAAGRHPRQRAHPGADGAADHRRVRASSTAPIVDATASAKTTSSSASTGASRVPSRSAATVEIVPIIEMFNTFNNANNINPLSTPALFDFARIPANRRRRSASDAARDQSHLLSSGGG